MYEYKDLNQEISAKYEWFREHNGAVLHPDAITDEILSDHKDHWGPDADFYAFATQAHVRNETRKYLNKFKIKSDIETDKQLVLPGFQRVQQYYVITREGEQCAVRVDSMTYAEIKAKCAELHAMSDGCLAHENELMRYWESKQAAA